MAEDLGDGDDGGREKFAELLEPAGGWGRPIAAPLPDLAELPGVTDLALVERAAQAVEPYQHAKGYPVWSVMLVERALGRQRPTGPGSAWRSAHRASYRRERGPER